MTPQQLSLEQLGWRQGSVLTTNEHSLAGYIDDASNDLFVIAPYSCAVVNEDFDKKEPLLELVRFKLSTQDRQYQKGRNPRILQLRFLQTKSSSFFNADIHGRYFVPHKILAAIPPSKEYYLTDNEIRVLSLWLAKRYTRSVLPTEFNKRAAPALSWLKEELRKLYKKSSDDLDGLEGIYLILDPDDKELVNVEDPYDVGVVCLLSEQSQINRPQFVIDLKNGLEEKLKACPGIALDNSKSQIESETGMPVSEFRTLIRLYKLSICSLAHGVLRRKFKLDFTDGSFLKQFIFIRLASSLQP